jgi:hypothetical protein
MLGYYKLKKRYLNFKINKKFKQGSSNFSFVKKKNELYLFGNGYTLKEFKLSEVENKDCFICNAFFRMPGFNDFILRNNVLDFGLDSFSAIKRDSSKNGISVEQILNEYVKPKVGIGISLIKNIDFFPYILSLEQSQSIATLDGLLMKHDYKKSDIRLSKTFGHTPQMMIYAAILMNYNTIHLYGLEHNYVKDILNKDSKCGTHFYGDTYKQMLIEDNGIGDRNHYRIKLSKLFKENASIFEGYEKLADLAKNSGIDIIDHSGGSLFMFQDYSLWDLVESPKTQNES